MMKFVQHVQLTGTLGKRRLCAVCAGALALWAASAAAQQAGPQTGPPQTAFSGLRAVAIQGIPEGQINALRTDAAGNLYLLIDQKDGVRLLKTDPAGANVLAQAQIGAKGDIGLAMALDPAGDVYVTGTTTSGALTATAGAAFTTPSGTATNSFVAKFDANLNTFFVTFAGGGYMSAGSIAATADAVFITGSIFSSALPVTASGIIQAPAFGSTQNGFVEKFSASGSTLLYATYLSGASGNTVPAAIAADASDDAYIAGSTTAPGYPAVAAVVPAALGATSGFLTRLTPAGDGITFSTFIPGGGITSVAVDAAANDLLLAGPVSLGQFPVASVQAPLTAETYQVLLRMTEDGSTVLGSTVLAAGTQSFVAAGAGGTAWVDGSLSLPLLPLEPLTTIGNSFAVRVNAANSVDRTARFGGIAASNPGYASAPVNLTGVAVDGSGNALAAGSFAPSASASLLPTQTFDLPLANAPTTAFPTTVHGAVLPPSACNGSLCAGSAAYLAKVAPDATAAAATAALALSVDDSPNLTLRNFGSAQAAGLQVTVSGFTEANNCGATLAAGGECSIALSGSGPGSITVSANGVAAQTQALPAPAAGVTALPVVFSPKELDFGIVSSASGAVTRTVTVTNLTQQSQTFASMLDIGAKVTLAYSFAPQTSDCTLAASGSYVLAPGGVCHIAIGLTASSTSTNDGAIRQNWLIGTRDVQMTAYGQAAALSLSAAEVDFGTQYTGGLRLPRYLYLSNNSAAAVSHAAVELPGSSPFSVTDNCPGVLEPLSVCQMQFAYQNTRTPSADAVSLSLDQGLTALVTGRSLPQPAANAASVNPNLSLSATALSFATAVLVTAISSGTQTLTIQNTGASAFALSLVLTGDFTDATNCGPSLAGGSSCSAVFTFAPSAPGTRQGLFAVTAGAGTTPAYVTLSGVATGILSPANNGALSFGSVIAGQPEIQWYKVTQAFTSLAAAASTGVEGTPFTLALVEDIGYGHGQPPASAFSSSASGTCFNCWLGVKFTPVTAGLETGALTLTSAASGNGYVLSLSGTGLPLTGLILSPAAEDFGPVAVNSASAPELFVLTNLSANGSAVTVSAPAVTGDFAISSAASGGAACAGTLAYSASCYVEVDFAPSATGPRTGTLTLQAGSASASASLTGYGLEDPGLSLNPAALVFANVPGASAAQQSVTLGNTGSATLQVGTPALSGSSGFSENGNCGPLPAGAACSILVTFTPQTGPAAGTLAIPVTSSVGGAPVLTTYSVPLTGNFTTEDAGIEILASDAEYGPQTAAGEGVTRQFAVNNLTAKSLALTISLPRQFVLAGAPCAGLAPLASCNFSVAFLPLDNGDITGTLFAQATPTDGSATLDGIGYVEGYGIGAGTLAIGGGIAPGEVVSFGQAPSGGSIAKTLTLTDSSPTLPLTIRRITSEWPFFSTSTCGTTLAPGANCTVTLTYTPLNQVAIGTSSPALGNDTGTLVIESDAGSSPDLVNLAGTSTPVTVASPSNIAPIASFTASQSSLSFGTVMAGNVSAPQTVTLDNTGSATVHILSIRTSADFTAAGSCGTLVPGASCALTVTFTPQSAATGMRASAIEIGSDASTPLEFVSLAGITTPSPITLGQTAISFGTVTVGASSTLPLTITNSSAGAVTFGLLSASGDYTVAAGTCPAQGLSLAAAASCIAQIAFTPIQPGTRAGTLSIATSASTLPLTVALSGVGAQSHLQISPGSLSFGSLALGASASLSLTLANTGTAPITGVSLAASGDYAVAVPCAVTALAAGASCSVTIAFAPAAAGTRPGVLTVTSSDSSSPDSVPLTGTGTQNGSFTLTVSGGASASGSVAPGSAASFQLTVTPVNGFAGTVVLNCTPVVPAEYAYCSLLPSSVTLSGGAQNAAATITTVTSSASGAAPRSGRFGQTALALLFPALFFGWKARTSRRRAWRTVGPAAWALFAGAVLLPAAGCGGGGGTSNLQYAPAGSYEYQVTASSTGVAAPVTQTVSLSLAIH